MKRPSGLTIISRAKSTWPAISGSTVTVAPRVPPASGSCSGVGSTEMPINPAFTQFCSPIGFAADG